MHKAVCKPIRGLFKFAGNHMNAWIPQVAAGLILFGYLQDALLALLQLRMHSNQMAALVNGWHIIGVIYTLLDITIILAATVLIACNWNVDSDSGSGSGVAMLLLQRTLRTVVFSIWDYELWLQYCVDVGCLLLLLLAMRCEKRSQRWTEWQHDKQERSTQCLLLLARIAICCVFLVWIVEPHQIINKPFAVACFISMLLGIRCKLLASLMIGPLLWQANGSLIWGWNDLTISMQFISSVLSKVAAFLLLTCLGGGKWSLDAFI